MLRQYGLSLPESSNRSPGGEIDDARGREFEDGYHNGEFSGNAATLGGAVAG
jgi:hypothetical protein